MRMSKFILLMASLFALNFGAACADTTLPETGATARLGTAGPSNNGYVLPPVKVVVPHCDPYTDLNWCKDGDCAMGSTSEDGQSISGCIPPPGGGGTPTCPEWDPTCQVTEPPPPSASTDTCRTGDPVVDDLRVWGGFAKLWNLSVAEGVERGGWIIAEPGGGYRLQYFQAATNTPCGVDIHEAPPTGAVSTLHTHPWPLLATNPCGYLNTGTPSDDDVNSLNNLGFSVGYIIDGGGIATYNGSGAESANRTGRCGY